MTNIKANVVQLRFWLSRLKIWQVSREGILVESLLFAAIYVVLLYLFGGDSVVRIWIEGLAVMVATFAAALLIYLSLSGITTRVRHSWRMLAVALLIWTIGALLNLFFNLLMESSQMVQILITSINLVAYVFFGYALLRFPSGGHYAAPTRFRFILDVLISIVAVASLGWLILAPTVSISVSQNPNLYFILSAPLADLILLVILSNVLLISMVPRIPGITITAALAAITLSDYASSSLELMGSLQPGSVIGLGWVVGPLLIGIGGLNEKTGLKDSHSYNWRLDTSLSAQFQKVLPIALVLVLFWYVLSGSLLGSNISNFGVSISIFLGLLLIVRLGIRAGEAELNNYWQLFKNLGDPTFICELDGNVILSNPAFHRLDNPREGSLSLFDIFSELPEDILKLVAEKKFDKALEVKANLNQNETPYLLSLNQVATDSRKVLVAGVAHNLSEQNKQRRIIQTALDELNVVYRQLEELNEGLEKKVAERTANLMDAFRRLEEQNKVLQELDQMKTDFVTLVSHELRNPLNNLGGGLELMLAKLKSKRPDKKILTLMQAETQRLTRFVESILNVSAIETGRLELELSPVSLIPIFESLKQHWRTEDEAKRIQLELQSDLPKVLAVENVLESVLRHLVDNAIKYAPEGPVIVSAEKNNGKVKVEVRDFGPGIASNKKNLIFTRFQRLEPSDSQSVYGYGLGLYFSRRMLSEMGSTIQFGTPEEGGARFYFTLELAKS